MQVVDASLLLEVVDCINAVLNSKGLDIVDISEETTRKLVRGSIHIGHQFETSDEQLFQRAVIHWL